MSRLIIEGDSSDLEEIVEDITLMRQVRLSRGDGIGDISMRKGWLEAQIEPDPEPPMPYPDPEPLTDLDKLRSRVNEIEATFDRRLDETKAHYEGLLKAVNGSDLNKLRYQLDGLEKTFNSLGPISLNQVKEIAKFEVNAALGCYPPEMAGFIQEMREWALKIQKDLEDRLKGLDRDYENEIKVEQKLHNNPSIRTILEGITRNGREIAEAVRRIENLETGSAYGGATDEMFAEDRKRIKAIEGKFETFYFTGADEHLLDRVKELEVIAEQDHKLLYSGDLGLGIRVENIETAIGGTDNEYDINRRLNELRDRERKLESVVTDLERIHQGPGHGYEPADARNEFWAEIKKIKDIIGPLERIKDTGAKIAMVEEDDLPDLVAFARDWKGGKLKADLIELREIVAGHAEHDFKAISGEADDIKERVQYLFDELHPNDPARAGGVVQDLYALQRTDYKNLTKRVDACMKEINGHGHTEFEKIDKKIIDEVDTRLDVIRKEANTGTGIKPPKK